MNRNRLAIFATVVAAVLTTNANASTLNLVQPDTTRGTYLTMNYNGSDVSGFAGALSFSVNGSSSLIDMFCADITTRSFLNSPYEAIALPPTSIANGGRAAWLFVNFDALAQDVVTGAALQLALWDVIHDGGDGLGVGLFRSTSSIPAAILTQATSYINASIGMTSSTAAIYQSVLGKNDRQQMIGQVPEPGTVVLLTSGLALAGWLKRKKA